MLRKLKLSGVGPAESMEFRPARRLNLITGDNGLGKSFLLDLSWWALTRKWPGRPARPSVHAGAPRIDIRFEAVAKTAALSVEFDRQNQQWRFPPGKPGQPGLVVYARVDGGFAVWDSNKRYSPDHSSEESTPLGLVFSAQDVWDGLKDRDRERQLCNGLLIDWISWQQTEAWEFGVLKDTLERLSPSPDETISPGKPARLTPLDSRAVPTLAMPYGEDVPVVIASAGMRRVISLAYLLIWAWREHLAVSELTGVKPENRMLVIVDEIEAHLHPKWQRVILPAVVNSLSALTGDHKPYIQYIIATHSPLVLASAETLFDEEIDNLFDLHLEGTAPNARVVLENPEFRRLGDAQAWLTSDAFGLSSTRAVEAEAAIQKAAELFESSGHPDEGVLQEVEARLQATLPDIDPFWTRWRALREGAMPKA